MKIKLLLLVLAVFLFCGLHAQTEVDERAYIHFDKGLGFDTPDSTFSLNIRFRMQNLLQFTSESTDDLTVKSIDARVRRLRLRFDGFLGKTGKLTYYMQLAFSREDQDWDNTHIPNIIRDAMVYYRFNKSFYIGFGQGKLPGNRQRITSSGLQQFMERSVVNGTFNIDRDFGIFGYYSGMIGKMALNFKAAVSSGEGRGTLKTNDGLAYTGRLEFLPFGKFKSDGDFLEGDIYRETKPKAAIGIAASYNDKAMKLAGQRGIELIEDHNLTSVFVDLVVKYHGWASTSEYCSRNANIYQAVSVDGDSLNIYKGYGINTQLSHMFENHFEIAARYSMLHPNNDILSTEPKVDIYTLGVTKYLKDHSVKIQANISYRKYNQTVTSSIKSDFQGGILVEVGI
jgi:hypothetical protein